MEQLIEKVAGLREQTKQYGDEVSKLLGISTDTQDPRSGCFGMIFNHSTLTLELLFFYRSAWSRPRTFVSQTEVDSLRKQNAERCNEILRWLFVSSLSSMEYSAKASIASYGSGSPAENLKKVKGKYVYLNDIMRNSKKFDLIDDDEWEDWQNLVFLRNSVVHNNAISDRDRAFDIEGTSIEAKAGKMLQGKLDFFANITEVAAKRYFSWVKAIIQEYGK